jgi:hypothetical protein
VSISGNTKERGGSRPRLRSAQNEAESELRSQGNQLSGLRRESSRTGGEIIITGEEGGIGIFSGIGFRRRRKKRQMAR